MFKKITAILVSGIFLGGCLSVRLPGTKIERLAEPQTLTWDSLVRQALSRNPDLQEARSLVASSARSRDIAFGDYLPSVEGGVRKDVSRTTGTGPHSDTLGLDINARQSLFDGFGTTGDWIRAGKELEAARRAYEETSADVRYRLRSSYINLVRIERLLKTNRIISDRRSQNAELVRLRYEAGRENLGSALRAEAIAEQAAFDVRQTERQFEKEALRLARESGGEFILPLRVQDDFEEMFGKVSLTEADYAALAEKTPTVMRLLNRAEAAKAGILSAQSGIWPQVDGSYEYGYTGDRASNLRDRSSLGITVSVPFFEGGKNVAAIRKAKSDYDAARSAALSARDETIAALSAAWVPYADAVEAVEVRRKFLEAARKRAEIIRAEYASGLVNFLDFDTAEQENANAEKEYVESLANVFIQQANWEKTRGATLEDAYDEIRER
ncbi:MAG: Outer membrane efflux protein BepC precursor [Candidatus Omnitrophica bacterium ADurb.Bin277]|nr:MAG: Outer membrane efflux protein BepC precursor [Candidatus Omnitrophica bacterium ADurb.Bin277]